MLLMTLSAISPAAWFRLGPIKERQSMKPIIAKWLATPLLFIAIVDGAHATARRAMNLENNAKDLASAAQCPLPGHEKAAPVRQANAIGAVSGTQNVVSQPSTPAVKYVGPTPNITAVANAIALRAKSLITEVTFKPGIAVTKPVTITLEYVSPNGKYRAPTETYDSCQGNKFLHSDLPSAPANSAAHVALSKPRQMSIKVRLTEERSDGAPHVYTIPLTANLDPRLDIHYDSRSTIQ